MPDNDLISFGYDVKTGMTGNPVFTTPPAALGTIEKVLPEYQSAITAHAEAMKKCGLSETLKGLR
jgi:hypothetical protein